MSRIFAFHGADSKVGTTMLSQCVAETLSKRLPDVNVLLLCLNGRASNNYTSEPTTPIDAFRLSLDSGLDIDLGILEHSTKFQNFYFISGVENELDERYYFPTSAEKLISCLSDKFGVIIGDTGSTPDNGLAFGGLANANFRYLILGQNENSVRRFENLKSLYGKLDIGFDRFVVNKYSADEPYGVKYLAQRLGIPREKFVLISESENGRTAEMEAKPLTDYYDAAFQKAINALAAEVAEFAGLNSNRRAAFGNGILSKKRKQNGQ